MYSTYVPSWSHQSPWRPGLHLELSMGFQFSHFLVPHHDPLHHLALEELNYIRFHLAIQRRKLLLITLTQPVYTHARRKPIEPGSRCCVCMYMATCSRFYGFTFDLCLWMYASTYAPQSPDAVSSGPLTLPLSRARADTPELFRQDCCNKFPFIVNTP